MGWCYDMSSLVWYDQNGDMVSPRSESVVPVDRVMHVERGGSMYV